MLHASLSEYAVCFDLKIFHDWYFPLSQMIPIFHICHLVNNTSLFCYKQAMKMHTSKRKKLQKGCQYYHRIISWGLTKTMIHCSMFFQWPLYFE